MIPTYSSHKWSIIFLHFNLYSYRTRYTIQLIQIHLHLNIRNDYFIPFNRNSLHRLCITLRTNKILRSHSYYKFSISHSIHWKNNCRMIMGRIFCRRSNIKPIFYNSFPTTIHLKSNHYHSLNIPTYNRIKLSHRNEPKY